MKLVASSSGLLLAASACLLLTLACSERKATRTDGAGGAAGAPSIAPTLHFELDGETIDRLALVPEKPEVLTIVVTPPDVYRVRFSIVEYPNVAPVDASLDRTDVDTDESGEGTVALYAPTTQSAFELQASIGNVASTTLEVQVSEKSFGELEVTPAYEGRRPIEEWFAVAYPSRTCPIDPPTTLADASCRQTQQLCSSVRPGAVLRIEDIWAGPSYAVTLGSGNHVWGCAQVDEILPGSLSFVTVPVSNRPILLHDETMTAVFGISVTTDPFIQHLNGAINAALLGFTGETANDLALVLEVMADAIEESEDAEVRAGFDERRLEHQWEYLAVSSLSSPDGLLLRSRLRTWMVTAADQLASDDALIGHIIPVEPQGFEFRVLEIAGIDAETAGLEPASSDLTSWTAEADDTLVLSTKLRWPPSRLVTALGEAQAVAEQSGADSLAEALGQLLDCESLADSLYNSNELGIYPGCDVECGAELCSQALGTLVERARDAQLELQVLEVSATAPAIVGELARPASYEGQWIGNFPGNETVVSGSIDGEPTSAN